MTVPNLMVCSNLPRA